MSAGPIVSKPESVASEEAAPIEPNSYVIRPNYSKKFRPMAVKEQIREVLNDFFAHKTYNTDECTEWSKEIAEELKRKIKDMDFTRYKLITQVVIGEQKGEAVKMGCRCLWDSDTDNYAQDVFMGETLFCVAAVFGVYYY